MYVWSEETLRGWRLEGGRGTLAAALGKRPSCKTPAVTLSSWPLTCEVGRADVILTQHILHGICRTSKMMERFPLPQ